MLHTSLVAAMAVGALGNARQDSLLDLMPTDAALVMELGDLHSMLAVPMEERGDWLKFLTDERTQAVFDFALEEEGVEVSSMALIGEMAAEIRGGAMAMIDMEEGPFVGAMRVTDEFEEVLVALFNNLDDPLQETEVLGRRALMDGMETLAVVEADGLTLMIAAEPGEVEATLESMLGAMEDGLEKAGWWTDAVGGLDQSIARVSVDFAAMPIDDDPDFDMVAEVIKSMHLDFNAGSGHEGGMSLSIEFHENEIVDAFGGAASEDADFNLLLMAPEGAQTLQVGKVDFGAMIEALVMFVDAVEPGTGAVEGYEAGLEAGSTFLGIDIQSELLDNLNGDVIGFQWVDDTEAMLGEDVDSLREAMPVFGLGINDPEPFIELLEIAEPFAADFGGEVYDEGDITTFSVEIMPGFEIMAQVSPNFLYIGADQGRLADTIAREGTAKADGAVDDKTFKLAMETMTGPGVSIWDISLVIDIMMLAFEEDETIDVPDEVYEVFDAFADHIKGIGMNDFQFVGNTMTIRAMTR